MPMTYRRPPMTTPMTPANTHLSHFSDDLRRPLPMTSDNTPLPLKGEPYVVGSPLGELPPSTSMAVGDGATFSTTQAGLATRGETHHG